MFVLKSTECLTAKTSDFEIVFISLSYGAGFVDHFALGHFGKICCFWPRFSQKRSMLGRLIQRSEQALMLAYFHTWFKPQQLNLTC